MMASDNSPEAGSVRADQARGWVAASISNEGNKSLVRARKESCQTMALGDRTTSISNLRTPGLGRFLARSPPRRVGERDFCMTLLSGDCQKCQADGRSCHRIVSAASTLNLRLFNDMAPRDHWTLEGVTTPSTLVKTRRK